MNNLNIRKQNLGVIKGLRTQYLDELFLHQELFLEIQIESALVYGLYFGEEMIAYAIVSQEKTLLEFYVLKDSEESRKEIFSFVLKALKPKNVYCKSFDTSLRYSCEQKLGNGKMVGRLFREFDAEVPKGYQLEYRLADEKDFPLIAPIREGIFDSDEEITYCIAAKSLYMFYDADNFIGCGLLHRVIEDREHYDLGMLVHPHFRRQGYAVKIIHDLYFKCSQNGWIPSCGCEYNNIGSYKSLEKAGFINTHSMLEFTILANKNY